LAVFLQINPPNRKETEHAGGTSRPSLGRTGKLAGLHPFWVDG